ncbi:transporter substrate-binding domain-containing protein [Italian clover phyllody phytoplasma]|uniref:transporter substrate-binding domain-containing protein n=1 Tax=Italian clover phyllody phytoplasma TaxID=1196420 RepID=UPI00031D1B46|nr:hypothetical protein [Italian clover phyllody phytoplasma]
MIKKLVIKMFPYNGILNAVQNDTVDSIIRMFNANKERDDKMIFLPYFYNQKNKAFVQHEKHAWRTDLNSYVKAVEQDNADILIQDYQNLVPIKAKNPYKFKLLKVDIEKSGLSKADLPPLSFFLNKDNVELKKQFETHLKDMKVLKETDVNDFPAKLENFNTGEDSKCQKYLNTSQTIYDQNLNKDKKLEKQNHFWSNLWRSLPSYKTGFMITLLITMDEFFLGLFIIGFIFSINKNQFRTITKS